MECADGLVSEEISVLKGQCMQVGLPREGACHTWFMVGLQSSDILQ